MPTAENAKLEYEAGQDPVAYTALTDQGDQIEFRSTSNLWSNRSGYEPSVRPNGLISGCVVTTDPANDKVNVSAGLAYIAGVQTTIDAAADKVVSRGADADVCRINSITITSAGAIDVVEGTDHTAFSETRGAAGGPPWIDNDAIEIAQVRLSSVSAALVTADEIKQIPGVHCEMYNYPTWEIVYGEVENGVLGYAGVDFTSALDAIHSEDSGTTTAGKLVYASWDEPEFAEVPDAYDFTPPANSHSVTSKQVYGRTKGARSSTLNAGSFSMDCQDGISDGIMTMADEVLWFRFYQDRLRDPYILCQGSLGMTTSFPAGDSITAACTIAAETVAMRVTN